ncbi:MAG: amidase [Chloroflexi bacterium]|nr:amidase [Chloroflexota bacterium]
MGAILSSEAATIHHECFVKQRDQYHPTVASRLEAGLLISATTYLEAQRVHSLLHAEVLLRLFRDVDVLFAPVDAQPAPSVAEGRGALTAFTAPFNLTGLPTLALPWGFTRDGLPLSMQLVGAPLGEVTVIQAGCPFQDHTEWHTQHPPRFS